MKKIIFLLLVSINIFAQDFAKDTLIGNTKSSIIKIKNSKIFITQNQELSTPYLLQKDGSFISNGQPFVQIHIDKKKHTIGTTYDYVDILFDKIEMGGSNEIITIDNIRVLVVRRKIEKDKAAQVFVFYPLKDRFLNLDFVLYYKNEDDRIDKENKLMDIIEQGIFIVEDYYLSHKN